MKKTYWFIAAAVVVLIGMLATLSRSVFYETLPTSNAPVRIPKNAPPPRPRTGDKQACIASGVKGVRKSSSSPTASLLATRRSAMKPLMTNRSPTAGLSSAFPRLIRQENWSGPDYLLI